jgi:hypothetical protein
MVTTFAFPEQSNINEKKAKYIAAIVTAAIATLLLLILILIKIITPIPPIPPPVDVTTVEIGFFAGSGGDAATQGGGSDGNTGEPGIQTPANNAASSAKPVDNGAVTDPNSDNAAASNSNHTAPNDQPKMDAAMLAAIANFNKNKGKASINVGGDGKGDPYTGGLGNGSGSDHGTGAGDPGVGGPGGHGGDSPTGSANRVRHIEYKPEIVNPTQEEGKVVVNVYVDRAGVVKKTEVNANGTTTLNSVLRSTATQSAYKIKFDADPSGPELLLLPIDIYFTLK